MGKHEAELLAGLTDTERAALPSRLRALERDELTTAWSEAKAARDAAIADAERVAAEALAAGADPVTTGEARLAAIGEATDRWAARKAELVAQRES